MRVLNPRPRRYKHRALPTELMELKIFGGQWVGFEPTNPKEDRQISPVFDHFTYHILTGCK